MTRDLIPWIGGAALAGGAVFFPEPFRFYLLLAIMLVFPLADPTWRPPAISLHVRNVVLWALPGITIVLLVVAHPASLDAAVAALLIAALPEEWFFRGYFMTRMQDQRHFGPATSNLIASLLFSLIHGLSRSWVAALLVLAPSLFYGWLYQRTRDLPFLVLIHALSNLAYILYLAPMFDSGLAGMAR